MTEDTRPDAAPQASGTAKQPEGSAVRDRHSDYAPETRGLIETSKQLTQVSLPARVHDIPSHLVNKTCINTRDQHILHCNLAIASTQSKYALHEHKKASTESCFITLQQYHDTQKTTLVFSRSIEIGCFANKNRAKRKAKKMQGLQQTQCHRVCKRPSTQLNRKLK